jgi:hypothetical protein
MELREAARDVLLQRAIADRHAAPEWQAAMTGYVTVAGWLMTSPLCRLDFRQLHCTCQLTAIGLFVKPAHNQKSLRGHRGGGGGG